MTFCTHYCSIVEKVRKKSLSCGRRPEDITIVAVSKNIPSEIIEKAYLEGCRNFGESRVQEALGKISCLPKDCQWHFIGTLQKNKISKIIGQFGLIHSVDTPELAEKISQTSETRGIVTPILLQVNISGEPSKHGLSAEKWQESLESVNQFPSLCIKGLMTMAPLVEDEEIIRACFRKLRLLRDEWKNQMREPESFQDLSMGMTHDYLIAIEEGATLLRIGTAIFGRDFL